MTTPEFYFHQGQAFKPVKIPATGEWQLMRMAQSKCYILVHPNGRQAWFHDTQINEVIAKHKNFRFSSKPLKDLQLLAKFGLRPFHVDPDFDPTTLGIAVK